MALSFSIQKIHRKTGKYIYAIMYMQVNYSHMKTHTHIYITIILRVPAEDGMFSLILWYVAKTLY